MLAETSVWRLSKRLAEDKHGVMTDRDSVFSPSEPAVSCRSSSLTHITSQEKHLWLNRAPFDSAVCWRAPQIQSKTTSWCSMMWTTEETHLFTRLTVGPMTKQPFVPPDSCLQFLLCFICVFVMKNPTIQRCWRHCLTVSTVMSLTKQFTRWVH